MNYLKYLVEEIHTTVAATVDDTGLPVTAAIDMMNYDEDGLYRSLNWDLPSGTAPYPPPPLKMIL